MDTSMARASIALNGVRYRWPSRPIVVVCIDGGDPAYFARGVRDGVVPNVARFTKAGFAGVADGDVPSFTCPNNIDRKSTRLNSSHPSISYAVFCLKKKKRYTSIAPSIVSGGVDT